MVIFWLVEGKEYILPSCMHARAVACGPCGPVHERKENPIPPKSGSQIAQIPSTPKKSEFHGRRKRFPSQKCRKQAEKKQAQLSPKKVLPVSWGLCGFDICPDTPALLLSKSDLYFWSDFISALALKCKKKIRSEMRLDLENKSAGASRCSGGFSFLSMHRLVCCALAALCGACCLACFCAARCACSSSGFARSRSSLRLACLSRASPPAAVLAQGLPWPSLAMMLKNAIGGQGPLLVPNKKKPNLDQITTAQHMCVYIYML